jgi:hypothetical protein
MLQILASSSCLQVSTSERYREGGNISLKKSLLLEEKGKAKGSPSLTEMLQQAFRRLVLPDARRFWLPSPDTAVSKEYITRIVLAAMLEG